MSYMLYVGKSGAQSYQTKINVGAHNIANSNTTAFKQTYCDLQDLNYFEQSPPDLTYLQGAGSRAVEGGIYHHQGALMNTGVTTHYAVSGEGYFGVVDPQTNELMLTRDGSFARDNNGNLVDSNGNRVMTQTLVNSDGQTYEVPLLYQPMEKVDLTQIGNNNYRVDPNRLISNANNPENFGKIENGFLESSNVDLGEEMTNLIVSQRAYSMSMKVIQTADETEQIINNLR